MKSIPLNLSRYRKVAEDDKTSTFEQHDTGHRIQVAHKALPREQRTYLKNLPIYEGNNESLTKKDGINVPRGTKNYAEGGVATSEDADDGQHIHIHLDQPQMPSPEQLQANEEKLMAESSKNASDQPYGTVDRQYGTGAPIPQSSALPQTNQISDATDQISTAQAAPQPTPPEAPVPPAETPPAPQPEVAPTPASSPTQKGPESFGNDMQGGMQEQLEGIKQQGTAEAALGIAQAKIADQAAKDQQELTARTEQKMNDYMQEFQHLAEDAKNSHVDPDAFWDNHSKFATGLGIVLAGFNPTNQPNAAIEFLNKSIDRDTQAQMKNMDNKNNVLAHYIQHFGNIKDAATFISAGKRLQAAAQIEAAAYKAQDPIKKAEMLQKAGQIKYHAGMELRPLALAQTVNQAMEQGNDVSHIRSMLPEPLKKEVDERTTPLGYAAAPVTQAVKDTIEAKLQLKNALSDLYSWSSKHSGEIHGLNENEINIGKAKAAHVQNLYRAGINGGVFKKGEQDFIDQSIDSEPTKFFNRLRVLPKLKEVMNSNNSELSGLAHIHRITPIKGVTDMNTPQAPQQDQSQKINEFKAWVDANPDSPQAKAWKKLHG